MAMRICTNFSLILLALWAGAAWWLLVDQGWNASAFGALGALVLAYMFAGFIAAAGFAVRMIWQVSRPSRSSRPAPVAPRSYFVPAMAARRVAVRRQPWRVIRQQ